MKLLRHLAGYTPVSLASGVAAFGGVYIFTRLLSPEDYGRYALMLSVLAIVHTVSLTPAEAATYRFAGKAHADGTLPNHYRTVISLTIKSILLAAIIVAALAFALGQLPEYLAILPWIALLLPLNTILQIALESHRASQRVRRYVLVEGTRLLAGFALGALVAWQFGFGAASPFIGMAIAGICLALPEGRWLWQQANSGRSNSAQRRAYLGYGIPIAAALVLDILLSAADRFLIALFLGEASVGEYAAGYGVADKTVLLLCAWAAMAASPLMMAAYERDGPAAAAVQARGLIRTLYLIGIPAATGLALVAQPLAEAMIGADVREGAAQIIPWIAFAGLLNGLLIHYFSEAFQLVRKTGERALLMIIPASANIVLNLILIPQFGLMGAVAATLASYALGVFALASIGRRHIALPLNLSDLVRSLIAAAAMWPMVTLLPAWGGWPELIAKALVGAATYVAVALLLDAGGARDFLRNRSQASKGRDLA